jgi:hypothetical protein
MSAIKLRDEFVELARREAKIMRRSIAGQVEHWAVLGRQCESLLGSDKVRMVLEGKGSVHDLTPLEDARYIEALGRRLEGLDGSDQRLLQELAEGGHPIAGEDEHGKLVVKRPSKRRR